MKLTVDNLPAGVGSSELREMFEAFGTVASAKLITDDYGEPTGFGEVVMPEEDQARTAMESLDDTRMRGRVINVYETGSVKDAYSIREMFRE